MRGFGRLRRLCYAWLIVSTASRSVHNRLITTTMVARAVAVSLAVKGSKQQKAALAIMGQIRLNSGFLGSQRWDLNPRSAVYEIAPASS